MSSWKIETRAHRERAQPASREKFGLLEKHKDYVERAKNFHSKEKRLLMMKRRAASRNPDEFYFGMLKQSTTDGVHVIKRTGESPTPEVLKVLKTQDIHYVRTKQKSERKHIEALRATLHGTDKAELPSKRTIFVDSEDLVGEAVESRKRPRASPAPKASEDEEEDREEADREEDDDEDEEEAVKPRRKRPTHDEDEDKDDEDETERKLRAQAKKEALARRAAIRERLSDGAGSSAPRAVKVGEMYQGRLVETALQASALSAGRSWKHVDKLAREHARAELELKEREKRATKLGVAAAHFAYQKHLVSKGRRTKIADAKDGRPAQFRWKTQRKR